MLAEKIKTLKEIYHLFKHKQNETLEVTDEQESIPKETSLVEYKESLFVKIINKIKNIFHLGKKI